MGDTQLTLRILPGAFAISRLSAGAPVPAWATGGHLLSMTRTRDELSIVSDESFVPEGLISERDWKCLKVEGTLDFSLVGILASIISPLAKAGISIFTISTYDTDYVLVKSANLATAASVLEESGLNISIEPEQEK